MGVKMFGAIFAGSIILISAAARRSAHKKIGKLDEETQSLAQKCDGNIEELDRKIIERRASTRMEWGNEE